MSVDGFHETVKPPGVGAVTWTLVGVEGLCPSVYVGPSKKWASPPVLRDETLRKSPATQMSVRVPPRNSHTPSSFAYTFENGVGLTIAGSEPATSFTWYSAIRAVGMVSSVQFFFGLPAKWPPTSR